MFRGQYSVRIQAHYGPTQCNLSPLPTGYGQRSCVGSRNQDTPSVEIRLGLSRIRTSCRNHGLARFCIDLPCRNAPNREQFVERVVGDGCEAGDMQTF